MYDFEGTRPEGAPDTPPLPRPPVLLTALEAARWLVAFDALGDAPESVRGADLVVLAAPVRQNARR